MRPSRAERNATARDRWYSVQTADKGTLSFTPQNARTLIAHAITNGMDQRVHIEVNAVVAPFAVGVQRVTMRDKSAECFNANCFLHFSMEARPAVDRKARRPRAARGSPLCQVWESLPMDAAAHKHREVDGVPADAKKSRYGMEQTTLIALNNGGRGA